MNTLILDFLNSYADNTNPQYAVMLKGKWGCGKTHLIKEWKKRFDGTADTDEEITLKPIYISTYGMDSVNDIKTAIDRELNPFFYSKTGRFIKGVLKLAGKVVFKTSMDFNEDSKEDGSFSATLDSRVKDIINQFSKDPIHISVKSGNTSDNVNQDIVRYDTSDKIEKLHDILIEDGTIKTIIFEDTQRDTERLAKELIGRGFSADSIHGGKSQSQRRTVLKKFKASEVSILVATDVAARGLDVPDISHVVNYALPQTYADYVHRIGRTGRAGKVGTALTFVKR